MLGPVEKGLLALLLLVLMTGMGATLERSQFVQVVSRPRGLLVGLASQFGWMPLIAFGLAHGLSLPAELALGLILVACTPGGTTSNLFTYYSRADLPLSISMTVTSTVVAVVAMPAVLAVYATPFTGAQIGIPYGSIVTTLLLVLLPVALGMYLRVRSPAAAARAEQLGSISGVLVLVLLVGVSVVRNRALFAQIPAAGYVAAAVLGIAGMLLGYGAARAVGLSPPGRRAVALETGIQNSPLAFAIILATFPPEAQDRMLWLPMLYALFVLISASIATLLFRRDAHS